MFRVFRKMKEKFKKTPEPKLKKRRISYMRSEIENQLYTPKRTITDIIVHCTASPDNRDIGRAEIDLWHRKRGWKQIGYHFVIRRTGFIEPGRPVDKAGAHCKGNNSNSIGIVLVGIRRFDPRQFLALNDIIARLKTHYPKAVIKGHREYRSAKAQGKTCPNFDVKKVLTV